MNELEFGRKVVVEVPCSTSNLGPGFDVFGLALDVLKDRVEVELIEEPEIYIEMAGVEADSIPTVPEKNSAGKAALQFMERYPGVGYAIKVVKGIPPISGLGSSGATAAAATFAIDHLLGTDLDAVGLVDIARKSEIAAPHADNVAPSICGGFVIIRSYNPLDILLFPPPENMEFALVMPRSERTTREARGVLPSSVEMSDVIHNIGGAVTVLAGVLKSDPRLFGLGLSNDRILEPNRGPLYPGYFDAKAAAMDAGACGANISGAGPTIIAVVDPRETAASEVVKAMRDAYEKGGGMECKEYIARPASGAEIIG